MWKLLVLPVFLVAFLLAAFLVFYRGTYSPPPLPDIAFQEIESVPVTSINFPDQPVIASSPVGSDARGHLLIDAAHRNNFGHSELNVLLSRVSARGYSSSFYDADSRGTLAEELSQADAFLVILPVVWFSPDEIAAVLEFVQGGGKVLLIGDPGRFFHMNDLSEPLGVFFQPDFLYNLDEYDSNFREIFVRDFEADPITTGVNEVALYYAGSLQSAGPGLAYTGGQTLSSISEVNESHSPIAIGAHRNVLAVYDWTFMIPPYSGVKDNARLVSNIADFLTESERTYRLTQFPRFFQGDVDILVEDPGLVTRAASMKQLLSSEGVTAQLQGSENVGRDTVYLGLFSEHSSAARYLEANGILISDTLTTPFASGIPLEDRAVISLNSSGDRDVLVIMADSAEGLGTALSRLQSGAFRSSLVNDNTGVLETK